MDQPFSTPVLLHGTAPPSSSATHAGPRPATACLAALAHLTIIAAAVIVLPSRILPSKPDGAIPIIFQPEAPPIAPQMLATETLPTPTLNLPDPLTPIAPLSLPADPRALLPRVAHHRNVPARTHGAPQTDTVQQAAPSNTPVQRPAQPPAPSPPASARALQIWEASVHQAVQNALVYPNAARLMHREGRARVRFEYTRNAVSSVAVAQSSGLSSLDRAAADAVMRAAIPPPPPEVASRTQSLILWVDFSLTTTG